MGLLDTLTCRQLHTVSPELLLNDVIGVMREKSVSSILVKEADRLIGLLTERDIVRIVAMGIDIDATQIKDVMTPNVITLPNDKLLDEALLVMEKKKIRHLVVVDSEAKPIGIITHTDIVRKLEEEFFKAPRPVKEYMSERLETVTTATSLSETVKYMHEKKISSIVVVEGQKPVGILTERDVVKLLQEKVSLQLPVEQFMNSPIVQVDPTISLFEASRIMEKNKIRHLVVRNEKGIEGFDGLLTNTDIVRSIRDNYRSYLEKEAIRTRKILDLIHEGVVEIDGEGYGIQWINQTGANLFGYLHVSNAIGENFIAMIEEDDREVVIEDFLQRRSRSNFQCRMKLHDKVLITLISYEVMTDDFHQEVSYRILIRDITTMVENRKVMEEKIRKQKRQFQALFDNTTDAVVIFDRNKKIELANHQFLVMFGYTSEEVKGYNITTIVDPKQEVADHIADNVFLGETASRETCRYTKAGEMIHVLLKGGPVIVDDEVTGGYAVYSDITERKKIINDLRDSEEKFRTLIESMAEGMTLQEFVYDEQGEPIDYRFIEVNPAFEVHTGITRQHICGRLGSDVFKKVPPPYLQEFASTERTGKPIKIDAFTDKLNKTFRMSAFSPKKGYFATLFEDITEEKRKEEQIQYLIYHDVLSGVYNRAYFDKTLKEIDRKKHAPTCIIMADLNGLKLVNDAFGHEKGDELIKMAATTIREVCATEEVVARIGGDEFAIIMPNTHREVGQERIQQLKERTDCLMIEGIQLSISFGLGVKINAETNIYDVVKLSEVQMYNRKLVESQSAKNHLMTSLLKVLEEKTGETHDHCQRVLDLGAQLGTAIGLADDDLEKIKVLALLHDIGNITIPEYILKKPESLSEEEWSVIKKHPESGYRIVSAIPEFSFIAEYILCHHERIDGTGYPRGIKGADIPKIAKVLAIVDAYEVMTRDTAYRKAMGVKQAVEELKANAGTQFDLKIVDVFINRVVAKFEEQQE